MKEEEKKDWIKAGRIAAEAREYGKSLIKSGASMLEVVEKIEKKIYSLNAKPAFPAQVSVDNIAAHYTPQQGETSLFNSGNLVKLDVGVHVNGAIGDTAVTINLGEKNKELVKASEQALEDAIKIAKIGTELRAIGKAVESAINSFGFNPVKNLTGHEIKLYEQHAGMAVPNFDNKDTMKLKKGQVIAIEPFATNGRGYIQEGKKSGIYKLEQVKNIRDNYSREVLTYIFNEYKTLPFAKRWLISKFGPLKAGFSIRNLEREGIIAEYNQLPESSNGIVSQAEHTLLIDEPVLVLTKNE